MAKVGVLGARGRMGREVVRTVGDAPDLEVAAEVDQGDALDALTGCDLVVDFTHPGVVMSNLHWCVLHDLDVVVGTSGFAEERLDEVRGWLSEHEKVRVLVVPNFSVGAILMMRFSAQAARFFDSAEVIELHHANKADAPSGTALRTASMIAAARAAGGRRCLAGRHRVGPAGRARRQRGRRARPLGAVSPPGSPPGGAFRRHRRDADDQARLPGLVPRSCLGSCSRPAGFATLPPGLTVGLEGLRWGSRRHVSPRSPSSEVRVRLGSMCRSIKTLRPPYSEQVTDADIRAAALQYVQEDQRFSRPRQSQRRGLRPRGRRRSRGHRRLSSTSSRSPRSPAPRPAELDPLA